jgi:hypothetical protein
MAMTNVEVTPQEILGAGSGGPLPATSPWLTFTGYLSYAGAIVLGTPTGGQKGAGTVNAQDYYINGQPFDFNTVLPITGGTLSGPLLLAADPTALLGTATKQYVDNKFNVAGVGTFLPLGGGTMTGAITLAADPATAPQAATKNYVDNRTPITTDAPNDGTYYVRRNLAWIANPAGITIPDAPQDGSTYGRNNGAWTNVFDSGTF